MPTDSVEAAFTIRPSDLSLELIYGGVWNNQALSRPRTRSLSGEGQVLQRGVLDRGRPSHRRGGAFQRGVEGGRLYGLVGSLLRFQGKRLPRQREFEHVLLR